MEKNITTILINSSDSVKNRNTNTNRNLSFLMDIPAIEIKNKAILKVANFCHIGTATNHADNLFLFKIKGVNVDNSKYLYNTGGYPVVLATTFNNNRSLYEENEITLIRQTINNIEILVDTISPDVKSINYIITAGGSSYLVGQVLKFTGGGGDDIFLRIDSVSSGVITSASSVSYGSSYSSAPTLSNYINGSGAVLTATISTGAITAIGITNAGLGYKAGQALAFTGGGGSNANITIATVSATGAILTFTITSGGTGYTSAPSVSVSATTHTLTATITPIIEQGILSSGISNGLNFCMTLRIEQDEF